MNLDESYIIFELDQAAYALPSSQVQHLEMLDHITAVPNTAPSVDGVVFSRGQVVPVINLRARFGLSRTAPTAKSRLIFLRVNERVVALAVDSAREFQRIPRAQIQTVARNLAGIEGNFVEGVTTVKGRSVLIVNVGAVLTLEEITPPADVPTLQA